jgi:peptidyl-prolyl cis-trans isomerase A (cyclophilin A)
MQKALLSVLISGAMLAPGAFAQSKAGKSSGAAHAPEVFRVKMNTTKGAVVIEVTRAWAPRGADRFYSLVRSGYFTDAPFFRVVAGFMAQFGIAAKPEVTKEWDSRTLPDDRPAGHSNTRGTISFANTGRPNSRGTQLFINYKDNSFLDTQSSPFLPIGQVVEGMDVVDQFYSGYGDTVNKEGDLEQGGKAYVDRYMPKLDRILTATIVAAPKPEAKGDEKK